MKTHANFPSAIFAAAMLTLWTGCNTGNEFNNRQLAQHIGGTKLILVAAYEPMHLYIYADTNSTNRFPDYAVFEGHEPVFSRENSQSNTFVLSHFENALGIVSTERDYKERIMNRQVHAYFDSDNPSLHRLYNQKYSYIDRDGDGLFDGFIEWGTNAASTSTYSRSNYSWIRISDAANANHR